MSIKADGRKGGKGKREEVYMATKERREKKEKANGRICVRKKKRIKKVSKWDAQSGRWVGPCPWFGGGKQQWL